MSRKTTWGVLFIIFLIFNMLYSCRTGDDPAPEQNPYLLKILGTWLAYVETHESIRKNSTDTLLVQITYDTNLLVFTEKYMQTYYLYTTDSTAIIKEYYKSMSDSVFYFGGYPDNTGEVLYVDTLNLVFKRFKGWYVPMDTHDTVHHLVTYECNRVSD
jgi:hypothetical protein